MYTVERSSQTEILPLYFASQNSLHEAGAGETALASYSNGLGPHMKGTPYVLPSAFTRGMSRSFTESSEYSGKLASSRGAARPARVIITATSLEGEITS